MSEVTFAKSFLATLDKRPIKLAADHVSDPRKNPNQTPYVLPKQTHPFPRKTGPTSSQQAQSKTITATLKPMKSGQPVTLSDIALDSTILDLKAQYAQKSGHAQDKIKLLLNKKPAADLKTLKELGVDGDVELSVMIMGGGATTPSAQTPAVEKSEPLATPAPADDKMEVDEKGPAPGSEKVQAEADGAPVNETAADILKTEAFWSDLQGFLSQRLRDEKEGKELVGAFKQAWEKR